MFGGSAGSLFLTKGKRASDSGAAAEEDVCRQEGLVLSAPCRCCWYAAYMVAEQAGEELPRERLRRDRYRLRRTCGHYCIGALAYGGLDLP